MEEQVLNWITQYGYIAIYLCLVLGIIGLPIPDETMMTFSGYLVFTGTLSLPLTFLTALAGSISGITISYALGRFLGIQLVHRYGYFANELLKLAEGTPELRERIVPDLADLMAEVVVAARFEQAQSLADVFLRRTRLGLLAAPAVSNGEVPRRVAGVLGAELGWDDARIEAELSRWHDEAAEEGIGLSGVAAG